VPEHVPPTWLVSQIKEKFVNEDGFLSRTYPISARTIFDNFDDVAPFLLYYGESDFLLQQTRRLSEDSFENFLPIGNVLYAYKIDEYLGGLNAIYRATGDQHTRSLLIDAGHKCLNYFFQDQGHFSEFYDFRCGKASKNFSPWSSGLLETFLEITDLIPEMNGLTESILRRWLSHPYVIKKGLFPFRASFNPTRETLSALGAQVGLWCGEVPVIEDFGQRRKNTGLKASLKRNPIIYGLRRMKTALSSGHWSQLMKSNTTPAFTMIALYTKTHDDFWKNALNRWINAVAQHMLRGDGVHGTYPRHGHRSTASLVDSFIFIDVLCDMFFHVEQNEKLLDTAIQIAESCLKWRWENGLFPMTPKNSFDHIDGQVDFSIALRRIGDLSGRSDLKNISQNLMETALALHRTDDGLCTHVNIHGEIRHLPVNTVDPKYNGLALKGMIHLETWNQNMYGHSNLMDLFKDR